MGTVMRLYMGASHGGPFSASLMVPYVSVDIVPRISTKNDVSASQANFGIRDMRVQAHDLAFFTNGRGPLYLRGTIAPIYTLL